ncbi:molybdenum ABC transporter ATP-binding protein [Aestuariivirga sp.]|uniref:molybdenum ABC transporter ATP-binding protein n=1 Tax=Aestuariivirga sp. TaxID=2650926 RepID=UPI003593C232
MSIAVDIQHRLGDFALSVAFESHGPLTAIFGASGSGKTSVVNVIAGLMQPGEARVVIDGKVLTDTSRNIQVPAHRRRIGYVFQDARLFPHLSVERNLSYGEWFTPRGERYAGRKQILDLLGIGHLLQRRPGDLSGGEKQRVAIGRALLASPRLLLMDEPLASLDQMRKTEIMPYLERLRDEVRIPIIYVSHSVAEVTRLATGIVVLADGRTVASGPAAEIARRLDLVPPEERDEGGAILDMTIHGYDSSFGMTVLTSDMGEVHVPGEIGPKGAAARVRIRARDVMLATTEPGNISALNIFCGIVARIDDAGPSSVNVAVDCRGAIIMARITRQSAAALHLAAGSTVYAIVKAVSVSGPAGSAR